MQDRHLYGTKFKCYCADWRSNGIKAVARDAGKSLSLLSLCFQTVVSPVLLIDTNAIQNIFVHSVFIVNDSMHYSVNTTVMSKMRTVGEKNAMMAGVPRRQRAGVKMRFKPAAVVA